MSIALKDILSLATSSAFAGIPLVSSTSNTFTCKVTESPFRVPILESSAGDLGSKFGCSVKSSYAALLPLE